MPTDAITGAHIPSASIQIVAVALDVALGRRLANAVYARLASRAGDRIEHTLACGVAAVNRAEIAVVAIHRRTGAGSVRATIVLSARIAVVTRIRVVRMLATAVRAPVGRAGIAATAVDVRRTFAGRIVVAADSSDAQIDRTGNPVAAIQFRSDADPTGALIARRA